MTARYKPYPEYKPSDVEWIGDVPEHWWVFGGKRIFRQRIERAQVDDEQLAATQQYGVIPQSLYMKENGQKVVLALKGTDSFRHVEENDFVISLRSFQGGIEHSGYSGCVSPAYTVLDAVKQIDFRYYRYLLKSTPYICALQSSTDSLREGKSITYEQFGQISLPLLPMEEQHAIAAFLDRETGKIDRMIGKQERMIELLKEKRQAVISNAVTKGIDPTAPMKDSGIEWLGQIPEHWKALQLRHCLNGMEQGKSPSCENRMTEEGEWGVLKSGCVNRGEFNQNEHKALPSTAEPFSEYEVKRGDLLMSRASGSRDLIGSVGYVSEVKSRLLLSDKTFRLKTKPLADKLFLSHEMSSQVVRRQIELAINGAEGLANNITQSSIRSFYIALPPIDEQKEIVQFLERETAKIDHLIAKAEQAIELMKERRTALISAAVTGKIDVSTYASTHAGRRDGSSNAYCVTDEAPEMMAAEEQAEYRVKE